MTLHSVTPSTLTRWTILVGALWVGTVGLPAHAVAQEGETAGVKLHRQIQALDRKIATLWDEQLRQASALPAPSESDRERLGEATRRLRSRLELLEAETYRNPPVALETASGAAAETASDKGSVWRAKLRSLRHGLDNLDRLAAGQPLPGPVGEAGGDLLRAEGARSGLRALGAATVAVNHCEGALDIGNGIFTGTTVGATNDGTASCGLSDLSADVWFRYVAPADGRVSMDTFGSDFDTVLSVYTGCPGSGTEVDCNDDVAGLQSALTFTAMAGTPYWIRVSGANGASGNFTLRIGIGGTLTGQVVTVGTGVPVSDGEVVISSRLGFVVQSVPLEEDGTYTAGGLDGAGYRVHTESRQGVRDEVWDNHPCFGTFVCRFVTGDDVVVPSVGTTAGVNFALNPGGAIAGTLRRAVNGDPVEGVQVEAWVVGAFGVPERAATTVSLADGSYSIGGLDTGSYLVVATSPEWGDQMYDGTPCPGGIPEPFRACDPVDGTEVAVTLGATTGGIDFDLDRLGIFEGTVTDATTGQPIEGARVEVQAQSRAFLGSALTDAAGDFRVAGLPAGSHFLSAEQTGYLIEVFEEIDCVDFCQPPNVGTAVPVALDQIVTGLDFTLVQLGSISGSLTDAVNGAPIPSDIRVDALTLGGTSLGFDVRDGLGNYQVQNLPPGDYVVRASPSFGSIYLGELYDDVPCTPPCDLATGMAVPVLPGTDTPGIDFALDRAGGISGTVTDATSGALLESVGVGIYDEEGFLRESASTSGSGVYTVEGLVPGNYFAFAGSITHRGELYDGIPCLEGPNIGCDLEDGTPVSVAANTTRTGIDFALVELGSIAGRISNAVSGDGLEDATVRLFSSLGGEIDSQFAGADGIYRFDRLPPGTYFVQARSNGFVPELYDNVVCPPSCDATTGTPVAVAPGDDVENVDIGLQRGTRITGRVVDEATGEPIAGVDVRWYDAEGMFLGYSFTDGDGNYQTLRLAPGSYFLQAVTFPYVAEVYDDLLCSGGELGFFVCSIAKGTPVEVTQVGDTTGIDFELVRFAAGLTGIVLDRTTGRPVAGLRVQVWNDAGGLVLETTTRHDGVWLADLPPGTYFASTDAGPGFFDQVFDGVVCGGSCAPLTGTPLNVATSNTIVRSVDFVLDKTPSIFTDGFESGNLSTWSRRIQASP